MQQQKTLFVVCQWLIRIGFGLPVQTERKNKGKDNQKKRD
jgi:hypothetical protein